MNRVHIKVAIQIPGNGVTEPIKTVFPNMTAGQTREFLDDITTVVVSWVERFNKMKEEDLDA